VLRTVARRLVAAVRPSDTVARLGGDEFVVLVESTDPAHVATLVERLRTAVVEPVAMRGEGTVQVGVSIGTAWSSHGQNDARTLLRRADEAMYADKRARSAS
ncbi:MAG TPA: GGDEF domain-containing protein, partial [Mycobacteriales bacterium]|nr:GGDEF domain-containing protein [Mycobacteriales bacterium]